MYFPFEIPKWDKDMIKNWVLDKRFKCAICVTHDWFDRRKEREMEWEKKISINQIWFVHIFPLCCNIYSIVILFSWQLFSLHNFVFCTHAVVLYIVAHVCGSTKKKLRKTTSVFNLMKQRSENENDTEKKNCWKSNIQ